MPAQPYYVGTIGSPTPYPVHIVRSQQPQAHTEQGTKSDDRKPTVPSSTPSPERSPGSTNNTGITEDPRYEEHTHSHQSRVYVCDDSPMVRVPPPVYASISPTPIIPVYPVVIQQSVAAPATGPAQQEEKRPETPQQVRSPKAKSRSGSRLRNISYKTKPCRYYIANGYCASGDQCTFIHGEATQNLSLLILNSAAAEAAKSKENATKPTSPSGNDDKKPTSPVTWRVIGGGVLMGDPTRCRSPSTTSSEGPTTPTSSSDNATDDEAVKDSEPKLEQSGGTVEFPRSIDGDVIDNDDGDVDRGTGKQEQPNSGEVTPTGRTRATSNPQSPSTAAVMRHDTLFSSAESPGVL
ncbi:hypothetical protein AX16_008334 [Volvariella volvacea WC 439]|nr:hypothetical protein AX16_008334 [Volvariella volvacea WC 439]